MSLNDRLIKAYQELYLFTKEKCKDCRIAKVSQFRCCSPEYCEMAAEWAKDRWGVVLQAVPLPPQPRNVLGGTLLFMGPEGCIVPPHMRPYCTMHLCEHLYMADMKTYAEYMKLREKIDLLEYKRAEASTTTRSKK